MNWRTAVPALVSCALPSRCITSQKAAVASQKFTWPVIKGLEPALTVAVAVTNAPDATVDTALPPEVRDKVVAEPL